MTRNITGRDGYIMMKALAYAIEAIRRLPPRWQEASDQEDMILLMDAIGGKANSKELRNVARGHLERRGTTVKNGRFVVRDPELGKVVPFVDPSKGGLAASRD